MKLLRAGQMMTKHNGMMQQCGDCLRWLPYGDRHFRVAGYLDDGTRYYGTSCADCRTDRRRFPGVDIDAIHRNPRWKKRHRPQHGGQE